MNARSEHEFLADVAGFVRDTLDAHRERRFLEHLAGGCTLCEEALDACLLRAAGIPELRHLPPPELRARLMAALGREPPAAEKNEEEDRREP